MTAKPALEDVRSHDPVERLLEDSWRARAHDGGRREMLAESLAVVLFLALAVPLALSAHGLDVPLACMLVALYALLSRMVKFPIGAGYVVPTYLVLVPMLLLLPVGFVPLLAAAGLVLGTLGQLAAGRVEAKRVLFSVADASHTLAPAAVLLVAAGTHGAFALALVYVAAFVAGGVVDLASSIVREAAARGVAPHLQLRVIGLVWLVDACLAPLGLLVAQAARGRHADVLLILPFSGLLLLACRERTARIESAQHRLDVVRRERARLQTAVRCLGDAFAAKLDVETLTDIVLRGAIEALDADAGHLALSGATDSRVLDIGLSHEVAPALHAASAIACLEDRPCQLERNGAWSLAMPFGFPTELGAATGALAVARLGRAFHEDEEAVLASLSERARQAATSIVANRALRALAFTDPLTKLGNRRRLQVDIEAQLGVATDARPAVLLLFDLDGFKVYNDDFGHIAGDALLERLGARLSAAVARHGVAYRLGGDEFCVLLTSEPSELHTAVASAVIALRERRDGHTMSASCGAALIPREATSLDLALRVADRRMYAQKRVRRSATADETRDVLIQIMQVRQPELRDRARAIAQLSVRVGSRLGMGRAQLDELSRAAELHDIGTVGIPDAVLGKEGELDEAELSFIHQHTVLGERILSAAPALRSVAAIVRATHERWDGRGYPDGRRGEGIPLGARVIAPCAALQAMLSERPHRARMSFSDACEELRHEAGRQFDPVVLDALLEELLRGAGDASRAPEPLQEEESPEGLPRYVREMLASTHAGSPPVNQL